MGDWGRWELSHASLSHVDPAFVCSEVTSCLQIFFLMAHGPFHLNVSALGTQHIGLPEAANPKKVRWVFLFPQGLLAYFVAILYSFKLTD